MPKIPGTDQWISDADAEATAEVHAAQDDAWSARIPHDYRKSADLPAALDHTETALAAADRIRNSLSRACHMRSTAREAITIARMALAKLDELQNIRAEEKAQ